MKSVDPEQTIFGIPVVIAPELTFGNRRAILTNIAQLRRAETLIIKETKQCRCQAPALRGDIRLESLLDKSNPDEVTIRVTYTPFCSCSECHQPYLVTMVTVKE